MKITDKKILAKKQIMEVLLQDLSLLKISFCKDQLSKQADKIIESYLAKKSYDHIVENLTKGKI